MLGVKHALCHDYQSKYINVTRNTLEYYKCEDVRVCSCSCGEDTGRIKIEFWHLSNECSYKLMYDDFQGKNLFVSRNKNIMQCKQIQRHNKLKSHEMKEGRMMERVFAVRRRTDICDCRVAFASENQFRYWSFLSTQKYMK